MSETERIQCAKARLLTVKRNEIDHKSNIPEHLSTETGTKEVGEHTDWLKGQGYEQMTEVAVP